MTTTSAAPTMTRTTISDALNRQIANWTVLYAKLHHFHWYVKGEQFFTLHVKFEELYNEAAQHIDELAERLLALGGQPVSTLKGCLQAATVQEAESNQSAQQMVTSVIEDFKRMVSELKDGMSAAQKENDESTADMLLGIHTGLEKHIWMLQSFLGKMSL